MFSEWIRSAAALFKTVVVKLAGNSSEGNASVVESTAVRIYEIEPGDGPAWGTLSGLTAHPSDPSRLYAVTDNDSPPVRILELDVSADPARVVRQIPVIAPGLDKLDLEAIVAQSDGGFWLASEGAEDNNPPNVLLEVDAEGELRRSIDLPESIASRIEKKGFEGLALEKTPSGSRLYVAFQAPLAGDGDDVTRIGAVDVVTGQWTFFHYPLERLPSGDFTGLSELLHLGNRRFAAIERDGKGGRKSVKWITTFELASLVGSPADAVPPIITKQLAVDLVPLFTHLDRKVEKEIEGLAIASDGHVYVVTDNDNERATLLLRIGKATEIFEPAPK